MTTSIRVLMADDHPLVRAGLRATLAAAADIVLVGEAQTGDEVLPDCQALHPDIVLLDVQMPGAPAAATVAALQNCCPQTRVIILTAHDEDAFVHGLLAAGAKGYVLKEVAPETLVQAIRGVAAGGVWFSQDIAAKLVRQSAEPVGLHLTARERELLRALEQGWSTVHIATVLHLSEQTVRNYLSRLYTKLEVSSRAAAMVWGRDHLDH